MDRRSFLRTLAGGTAAAVAVRSWPFRSYFFPKPAPRIMANDWIVPAAYPYGFEPGQFIAVYDSSGGLNRGIFRVARVDSVTSEMYLEYVPHPDLTGRPVWDDRAAGEWRNLSRAKYPGPLKTPRIQRPRNIDLATKLTEGIEQQDLLLRDVAAPAASWKRKLLRA